MAWKVAPYLPFVSEGGVRKQVSDTQESSGKDCWMEFVTQLPMRTWSGVCACGRRPFSR